MKLDMVYGRQENFLNQEKLLSFYLKLFIGISSKLRIIYKYSKLSFLCNGYLSDKKLKTLWGLEGLFIKIYYYNFKN